VRPWRRKLKLDWREELAELGVGGLIGAHKWLSDATGGRWIVPPTWAVLRVLVTPHPLGGCGMAASRGAGVTDHLGRVFGHPGLVVSDGSVFARPVGLNPSKTIAAIAERSAASMLAGG
jgi:cholesterol oxidase